MPCSKTKRVALQDPTSALMHRDILLILLRRMMLLRPVPMKSEDVALESHPYGATVSIIDSLKGKCF